MDVMKCILKKLSIVAALTGVLFSNLSHAADNYLAIDCDDKLNNQMRIYLYATMKALTDIKIYSVVDAEIYLKSSTFNSSTKGSGLLQRVSIRDGGIGEKVYMFNYKGENIFKESQRGTKYFGTALADLDRDTKAGKTFTCIIRSRKNP